MDPTVERLTPGQVRNVAIDVFELFVVAAVHHDAAIEGFLHPCTLVLEATEGGALHGRGGGIEGANLRDPTEPIRFVGLGVDGESAVGRVPEVAKTSRADAIATLEFRWGGDLAEVTVEVLFTRQIGVPRGVAHRAVVERSENMASSRIGAGHQPRVAGRGSTDADRGLTR